MLKQEPYYSGVLRITNPATLQKWKDNGEYKKLTDQGYIYSPGCGRFKLELCTCSKCRKFNKSFSPKTNQL